MKLAVLTLLCACTTLGPMPATTGISPIPANRPGLDAQVGTVPAFYASQSAQNEAKGAAVGQAALIVEPDRWIGVKGLVVGGRIFGPSGDTYGEPYVGYRTQVSGRISVGGGAYGSAKRATKQLASYHATRVGAEASVDARVAQPASWLGIHAGGSIGVTRILTSGTYCVDASGIAKDCEEGLGANNTMITGKQTGVYPAASATLTLASLRNTGTFRAAEVALIGSVGSMPLIQNGAKTGTGMYEGLGLTLTVGIGD
jgi:hypothetical protein